eukprot:c7951_g1_i2.p1 GENE.c7951_g1_i2~~c7951_g1_i2.p1  ORF type:complete len:371 (-),score=95.70 c7951_g1_i2:19-1107(-)
MSAFRQLLLEVGVAEDWTWDQAMKAIINDPRYASLRTLNEKKTVFFDVLEELRAKERSNNQRIHRSAREDFVQMLKESPNFHPMMSFEKAVEFLESDTRYVAVPEDERRELFERFSSEIDQTQRKEQKVQRKRHMKLLKELLSGMHSITHLTTWKEARAMLPSTVNLDRLDESDQIAVFEAHIHWLRSQHAEQSELNLEQTRKKHRKDREMFRQLIEEKIAFRFLTAKTTFSEFVEHCKDDVRYRVMSEQPLETTKQLFQDAHESLKEAYRIDKKNIRAIVEKNLLDPSSESTAGRVMQLMTEQNIQLRSDANVVFVLKQLGEKVSEKRDRDDEGHSKRHKHKHKRGEHTEHSENNDKLGEQ